MDISLVYFWCSKGFPDSIQSLKLCWHGWGPRICFLFLDHNALEDSQGERGSTGQEKHFSATKGKKVESVGATVVIEKQHWILPELLAYPIFSVLRILHER